jgi:aldehyde dehydrogenase (NAD+)
VDKVIFTGSSSNGREVLAALAPTNTPAVVELSGEDPVLVMADANLHHVVNALRFGARLNRGATCMAPRRVIAHQPLDVFLKRFLATGATRNLRFIGAENETEMVRLGNESDYGLGASIFARDLKAARRLARRLRTGFVTINDIIVPTADPRVPFGGTKASGFGTTRGVEGLLEMTFPHVVATRRDKRAWHYDPVTPADRNLLSGLVTALHGRTKQRVIAIGIIIKAVMARVRRAHQPI